MTAAIAISTAGCAMQRYRAKPLAPASTAAELEARSLAGPGLHQFLQANLGGAISAWPPPVWNLTMLADAALYFSPDMAITRAQASAAAAGVVSAGARPNPSLSLQPGVPSPYLLSLDWALPIITAGKRGDQVRAAQALSVAARLELGATAWRMRSTVRAALAGEMAADGNLRQLEAQQAVQNRQVELLNQRLAAGEIARPLVDAAQIDLDKLRLQIVTARAQMASTRAALAAAVGVPAAALAQTRFVWPGYDQPPDPDKINDATIERDAVVNRLDVRQALAAYQAAEANLQLEVARQHPDLTLGPGYAFEEGKSYFTVGLSLTLPIFNQNQGPIAVAEAHRQQAGAELLATQTRVIAQSDAAWAAYRGAYQTWTAARALAAAHRVQVERASGAFQAGETGPVALNGVQLQSAIANGNQAAALAQVQAALGSLEDALQRPLGPGEAAPPEEQK